MNYPFWILTAFVVTMTAPSIFAAQVESPKAPDDLRPQTPVVREFKTGEVHAFRVQLAAGEYLHLEADQKGVDLAFRVLGPDRKLAVEGDFPDRLYGLEPIFLVAEQAGDYRVEAFSKVPNQPGSSYILEIKEQTPATDQHRAFVAGVRTLVALNRQNQSTPEQFQQAQAGYESLIPIFEKSGNQWMQATLYNQLGNMCAIQGKINDAIRYLEKGWELLKDGKDRESESYILITLCEAYGAIARDQEGIEVLKKVIDHGKQTKQPLWEAYANLKSGRLYDRRGKNFLTFESLQQAIVQFRQGGDKSGEAAVLTELGIFLNSWWPDRSKAADYLNAALNICRRLGDYRGQAQIIEELGSLELKEKRYHQAIEYFTQADELARRSNSWDIQSKLLLEVAVAYRFMGNTTKALEYYEKSLADVQAKGNPQSESGVNYYFGEFWQSQGNLEKAIICLARSVELARSVRAFREMAISLDLLCEISLSRRDKKQALAYYNQMVEAVPHLKDGTELGVLYNLGKHNRTMGNLPESRRWLEQGIAITESLRPSIAGSDYRGLFVSSVQPLYELYITVLMDLHAQSPTSGYAALAFEAAEQARARGLLDLIRQSETSIKSSVDPKLLEQEELLVRKTAELSAHLLDEPDPAKKEALTRSLTLLVNELEGVEIQIGQQSPALAGLIKRRSITAAETQQLLDPDTVLLEYKLGATASYLFLVTRESIQGFVLPKRGEIEPEAQTFTNWANGKSGIGTETMHPSGVKLSEMILKPVLAQLTGKRVLIVPDGELYAVPFVALPTLSGQTIEVFKPSPKTKPHRRTSKKRGQPPPSIQYFIEQNEINVLPSASVLKTLREVSQKRTPAPQKIAVFANPAFPPKTVPAVQPNPSTDQKKMPLTFEDLRQEQMLSAFDSLTEVKGTHRQAEVISRLVPSSERLIVERFDANKQTLFKTELHNFQIVHFATHGLFDPVHPELSGLALSPIDERGTKRDGYVLLPEIFNLRLNAELVVLSACETGKGKALSGEGIVGVTRGFFYAGTSRIIASLWRVPDTSTAELMVKFYTKLLKGKKYTRPAAALREAQIEMLRDPKKQWHLPLQWAGFFIQGEYR